MNFGYIPKKNTLERCNIEDTWRSKSAKKNPSTSYHEDAKSTKT